MRNQIRLETSELKGTIELPASKSISNRLLILNALSGKPGNIRNLSESEDTLVLGKALEVVDKNSGTVTIDIGHAGTAMRFLTAYLSIHPGNFILTGSQRMKQRPIAKLVDALKTLGANIGYPGETGFPPLSIEGKMLKGGDIRIDSSISSQYISALMMIGPALEKGLTLYLENEVVSSSYINLTRDLMLELGIPVAQSSNSISIPGYGYNGKDLEVEGDWSAASYWYAIAALSDKSDIEITGLRKGSKQGDSALPEIFQPFGVKTTFTEKGIRLTRIRPSISKFEFSFRDNPDLVQTMAVLCCLKGITYHMTGIRTLKIKETDRILALQTEMKKLGFLLEADPVGNWISWDGTKSAEPLQHPYIDTYQDHRMAMAFAPAAIRFPDIVINDPGVVHKSYPGFWKDLKTVGFLIRERD